MQKNRIDGQQLDSMEEFNSKLSKQCFQWQAAGNGYKRF
jgi:hypothetical protein